MRTHYTITTRTHGRAHKRALYLALATLLTTTPMPKEG